MKERESDLKVQRLVELKKQRREFAHRAMLELRAVSVTLRETADTAGPNTLIATNATEDRGRVIAMMDLLEELL